MIVLDTDVLIGLEKNNKSTVSSLSQLRNETPESFAITSTVYSEFYYGLLGETEEKIANGLEHLDSYDFLNFDKSAAKILAKIKSYLEKRGELIPIFDMITAAIVLQNGATLVSNDAHFKRVPDLKLIQLRP